MALTVAQLVREPAGGVVRKLCTVRFDNSYTTGGKALVAADFGLKTLKAVLPTPQDGYVFSYDSTNGKLKVYLGAAEVANATDLSALIARVVAYGI